MPTRENALDAKVYGGLCTIAPDVLDLLKPEPDDLARQKEAFIAGDLNLPRLTYPLLDREDLRRRSNVVLDYIDSLHSMDIDSTVKQLYRAKFEECSHQILMLLSADSGNNKNFDTHSTTVYGAPSIEMLGTVLARLEETINATHDVQHPLLDATREQLESLLDGNIRFECMDRLRSRFSLSIPVDDSKEPFIDYMDIVARCQEIMNCGNFADWKVTVDETGRYTGMMAKTSTRELIIPRSDRWSKAKPHTTTHTHALRAHEFAHVRQACNGPLNRLLLLECGFADSHASGEAYATRIQHMIEGASDLPGYAYALAIGLCGGYFDDKQRNFRQVYELLAPAILMDRLTDMRSNTNPTDLDTSVKSRAWNVCMRIHRGTTGQGTGYCFTKDIAYRQGYYDEISAMLLGAFPFEQYEVGLHSPINSDHTRALRQLQIIK